MTDLPAAFETIAKSRRSVRAFKPDPIPQELLEHIFRIAGTAPSNCNAQPWITHVVSGDRLRQIEEKLIAAVRAGDADPDAGHREDPYVGIYKERRIGAAVALFEATGVGRHDKKAREESFLRNYRFFDAPHAAWFFMPPAFGLHGAADIGMYAQTLMLALAANGMGSCAQGALGHYSNVVKRELGVDEGLACTFGLSFGYPDEDHPSTKAITDRAPLSDLVHFHE
ncbi:nitroreductase [Novosphingopyxis sp. YJ-S2-01]|uniref:nitroreductase n=1 Tax=Novosphingopyxis sp. YJ-S2-01 TaxID=2794021 RepID=UPI0018DEAF9A|nr:nitroreductase [Novosphingopyxis sp. YJ-S2-01]MBH9536539.1 nitroreductase [Novosphingopyxis sp. YJ-S2-01]